jgi:hypothetical protein
MYPKQYNGGFNGVQPDRTVHPIISDGVIEGEDHALSGMYVLVMRNFHSIGNDHDKLKLFGSKGTDKLSASILTLWHIRNNSRSFCHGI